MKRKDQSRLGWAGLFSTLVKQLGSRHHVGQREANPESLYACDNGECFSLHLPDSTLGLIALPILATKSRNRRLAFPRIAFPDMLICCSRGS